MSGAYIFDTGSAYRLDIEGVGIISDGITRLTFNSLLSLLGGNG